MSSILTGFGLAALVQLATSQTEGRSERLLYWTSLLWIVSSMLLLAVMIGSETLRRREVQGSRMRLTPQEDERLWRWSEQLLFAFALALAGTAGGVILLGFSFSLLHGIIGLVVVAVSVVLIWK